jgi:uncharacterized protein YciI
MLTATLLALAHTSAQTTQSVAPESATPVPPRFFAVEFRTGPKWDASRPPNEQAHFQDHSSNLQRLRKEGRIVLGGRYTDRGLLILTGDSEEDVRRLFAADTSVANGVFVFDVWEFRPFYSGCVGAKPS